MLFYTNWLASLNMNIPINTMEYFKLTDFLVILCIWETTNLKHLSFQVQNGF
jgi:hypothetical protein